MKRTRALRRMPRAMMAVACLGALASAQNLIVNGDFSAGNAGFTTQYTYSPSTGVPAGVYDVRSAPETWNSQFAACRDHTTGDGLMMVINGHSQPVRVWSQSVAVDPQTAYVFSYWGTSVHPASPAHLQAYVNGVPLGGVNVLPTTTCDWVQFSSPWDLGTDTTATIQIIDTNTAATGNDFALDDVTLEREGCKLATYCDTSPNSVGPGALIGWTGSASVSANDLVLQADGCPPGKPAIFFYGPQQTQIPFGNGKLCVTGGAFRLQVTQIDPTGTVTHALDITNPPNPHGQISSGDTWNFQCWYRDPAAGGSGFNLSDAREATFCD